MKRPVKNYRRAVSPASFCADFPNFPEIEHVCKARSSFILRMACHHYLIHGGTFFLLLLPYSIYRTIHQDTAKTPAGMVLVHQCQENITVALFAFQSRSLQYVLAPRVPQFVNQERGVAISRETNYPACFFISDNGGSLIPLDLTHLRLDWALGRSGARFMGEWGVKTMALFLKKFADIGQIMFQWSAFTYFTHCIIGHWDKFGLNR
jgi:hypothetical protein